MSYKSHSADDVRDAKIRGCTIWDLDTATSGNDDTLIQELDETYEDVIHDILFHFELEKFPENWTMTELKSIDEIY